ncbi:MAG: hypothetical protein JWL87_106 [Candidatus Adlerbacteria bacterium]|nr:hypothetical protein [Candidatus Adlerbacteria bacterium]
MASKLSKTEYIMFRECPNNTWVRRQRPDIHSQYEISEFEQALAQMGNEVEELARGMFPGGYLIEQRHAGAQELTQKLVAEQTPVLFQAVFATDTCLAATDVLVWNAGAGAYDLYEIKMSSSEADGEGRKDRKKEEQFEYDLAFQANVVEACGVKLNKKYLVRLNRQYVRQGDLDFSNLFILEDKTEAMAVAQENAVHQMKHAQEYLSQAVQPEGHCPCYYKGRSAHCTSFAFINPDVPAYSVHDLNRIGLSKKYLEELLHAGVLHVKDVPLNDDRLTEKKLNQVRVHLSQEPLIDVVGLAEELNKLEYPLYFLDYETYPTAIPPFSGYRPYQHIVFQYSLHVLEAPDAELKHYGDLILGGDPAEKIAEALVSHIGPKGTVISWSKAFENSRNKEMAALMPEHKDFFLNVVERTYDLMDIVEHQHYVHPGFMGRASIKKVLPVLVPSLSYKELPVKSGTDAIEGYRQLTRALIEGEEAEQKQKDMLEYCKLDTLAMYEIWKHFRGVASGV